MCGVYTAKLTVRRSRVAWLACLSLSVVGAFEHPCVTRMSASTCQSMHDGLNYKKRCSSLKQAAGERDQSHTIVYDYSAAAQDGVGRYLTRARSL